MKVLSTTRVVIAHFIGIFPTDIFPINKPYINTKFIKSTKKHTGPAEGNNWALIIALYHTKAKTLLSKPRKLPANSTFDLLSQHHTQIDCAQQIHVAYTVK